MLHEEDVFHKYMTSHELQLTLKASELGVAPKVLSYTKITMSNEEVYSHYYSNLAPIDLALFDDGILEWYHCTMMRCDETVWRIRQMTTRDFETFREKFKRLHTNGILYFDVHGDNVMYGNGGEIYIIDYGHACLKFEVEQNPNVVVEWYHGGTYDLDLLRYAEEQMLEYCQDEYLGYRNLWSMNG